MSREKITVNQKTLWIVNIRASPRRAPFSLNGIQKEREGKGCKSFWKEGELFKVLTKREELEGRIFKKGICPWSDHGPGKTFRISPAAVLDAKSAPGISPFDRPVDTGDHAGAALQTTGKFNDHLPLLREGIEIGRTGIDTEAFFTCLADFGVKYYMVFFIIFKSVKG